MKAIKIFLRIPVGLAACLFMIAFIPFAGIIFFPGGLLWVINAISLLSPLVSWFMNVPPFLDMEYKQRLEFFLLPLLFPFLFGYAIIKTGDVNPDYVLQRFAL
jgi:hypothetical protein